MKMRKNSFHHLKYGVIISILFILLIGNFSTPLNSKIYPISKILIPRMHDEWEEPVEYSQFNDTSRGTVYDILVKENYIILADGKDGVEIIDISDPIHPIEVAEYYFEGINARSVKIWNSRLFVADYSKGLLLLNISNSTNPQLEGSFDGGRYRAVCGNDEVCVALDSRDGIEILNVSDPTNIQIIANLPEYTSGFDVLLEDHFAYIADSDEGIIILDLTDPTNPINSILTTVGAMNLHIEGDLLYSAHLYEGFRIFNISKIDNIILEGQYLNDTYYMRDITVKNDLAFIVDFRENGSLLIYNISDFSSIELKSSYTDGGRPYSVAVDDIFAYVGDTEEGLEIIDSGRDTDKDGIADALEINRFNTDPFNPDTDGDGLLDGEEINDYFSNPLSNDTDEDEVLDYDEIHLYNTSINSNDTDNDSLLDGDELWVYLTNPINSDTDGDLINDGQELNEFGTDPLNPDSDGDGLLDGHEIRFHKSDPLVVDSDGDGIPDGVEVNELGTDPASTDTDRDGIEDNKDWGPNSSLVPFGILIIALIIAFQISLVYYQNSDQNYRKIRKLIRKNYPSEFKEIYRLYHDYQFNYATKIINEVVTNWEHEVYTPEDLGEYFQDWKEILLIKKEKLAI